eukprot:jgi/Astpho2/3947/e_gw1.00063.17.1_t
MPRSPPIPCRQRSSRCTAATAATAPPPAREASAVPTLQSRLVPIEDPAKQLCGQAESQWHGQPLQGSPEPMGATYPDLQVGVNFALFSSNASGVTLCLFTEADLQQGSVTHEVVLDPKVNRRGDVWHILLPQLDTSLLYGFRVSGAHEKMDKNSAGQRFAQGSVVLDPYAIAVVGRRRYGALGPELDYKSSSVLGLAQTWPQAAGVLPSAEDWFDWQGDQPLHTPMDQLTIYEMHVRGFTQHASSGSSAPGTYAGLIEKLDYLQTLGVNALELMPVHEFNELEYFGLIPGSDNTYRFNYWGYSTTAFFAPMMRYSQAAADGRHGREVVREFKTLVRECHKRGLEVILDVVLNHTAEGNERGPTLSFRGLDNRVYYMLAPEGQYYNYSGCGNVINCNHPVVRRFIVDCLRYWVQEMHVDGFRFDLGSIMTRAHSQWHRASATDNGKPAGLLSGGKVPGVQGIMPSGSGVPTGTPLTDPPLIEAISEDPVLRHTKLIAEAWDCDGLNQVGAFPHYGGRWAEWNGQFRDSVRAFLKGTEGPWAAAFASAMGGSPTMYSASEPAEGSWWANGDGRKWVGGRTPTTSINFVTAHDGFALADLVTYNEKHNEANGEDNRDGENNNLSWNCGEEGETTHPSVTRLRARQMRNLAAALLLAHGVPMIQMGDEYGHSKGGNNNTYCHDDELNWFNWEQAKEDGTGFARFFRCLINLRRRRPELRRGSFDDAGGLTFHGVTPGAPDWSEESRLVAYTLSSPTEGGLYCAFNSSHKAQVVELPHWPGTQWQLLMDSGRAAPYDFLQADEVLSENQIQDTRALASVWTADGMYALLPRSSIILEAVPVEAAVAQPAAQQKVKASNPAAIAGSKAPAR